jgi:hypothetical protein
MLLKSLVLNVKYTKNKFISIDNSISNLINQIYKVELTTPIDII